MKVLGAPRFLESEASLSGRAIFYREGRCIGLK